MRNPIQFLCFVFVLLLVVGMVGFTIAGLAVPRFLENQARQNVARSQSDLRALAASLEAYQVDRAPGYTVREGMQPGGVPIEQIDARHTQLDRTRAEMERHAGRRQVKARIHFGLLLLVFILLLFLMIVIAAKGRRRGGGWTAGEDEARRLHELLRIEDQLERRLDFLEATLEARRPVHPVPPAAQD